MQHESALCGMLRCLSGSPASHPTPLGIWRTGWAAITILQLPIVHLFTHSGVCISDALPSLSPFTPSPASTSLLSMSASLYSCPNKIHQSLYLSVLFKSNTCDSSAYWLINWIFKATKRHLQKFSWPNVFCKYSDGYWLAAVIISIYAHTAISVLVQWKHIICQLSPFKKICDDLQWLVHD